MMPVCPHYALQHTAGSSTLCVENDTVLCCAAPYKTHYVNYEATYDTQG